MYNFCFSRTNKASSEYRCDKPGDIGRIDVILVKSTRQDCLVCSDTFLQSIHSDNSTIDLFRQFLWLIRWENLQDHAVETISTIDLWRQYLRLIRSDNFYDQSAETISTMRRMMTSESSPQVAKCSIEQYLILIKCLYCKIAIIKIDIFCWICFH